MQADLSGLTALEVNLATRTSLGDALTRSARMLGSRTAIADRGRSVTYRELDAAAESFGRSLLESGLSHQQPVAMLMGNSWQFVATYFACAKAGLVAMPVNVVLAPEDIAWILNDSGTTTVVADAAFAPLLEKILPELTGVKSVVLVGAEPATAVGGLATRSWEDLASRAAAGPLEVLVEDRDVVQCLYTSGTTSRPKGVLVSHTAVFVAGLTNALMQGASWGGEHATLVNVLPMFHTTGLNTLVLPTLMIGGTVVLPGPFDPGAVLDAIEAHRATHVMFLPIMYRALVGTQAAAARDLSSVKLCIYAMAPMPDALLDQVDEAFPNAAVILGSGQTEVVPATVLQWPEHRHTKANSWGPPVPTVEVQIMDNDGALLPAGETGEIVYRGPHVSSGYWNNADANRAAFAHGWFHSGDVGHLDEDGVVWFTDRLKDIIKSGGENVSSVDVERVVSAAPGVQECSVVGLPDERWGEAVCAVVVATDATVAPGELEAQVIAHAKQHLAGFQVPKRVIVVDELPKTATGKARKHELRAGLSR
ncbi:class I adenylate-forming enzyme family protein [Rhodococcus sp. PvR099]|uniref:class I adenylate-forming enzyme family protein n=1 Tax=Rhodococcus sp. PvR099 TaxID=2806602 RepID=UPI001AE84C94|nr:AMP-binding protein [Rhodococcus sp. PvR099]MBP1160298.1 acyl-CoA synthetase (AMP-forming)/AMP-acid ligase II [Rhodococcus sp. PvR099]